MTDEEGTASLERGDYISLGPNDRCQILHRRIEKICNCG